MSTEADTPPAPTLVTKAPAGEEVEEETSLHPADAAKEELAVEEARELKKVPDRDKTVEEMQSDAKRAVETQAKTLIALDYLEDRGDCRVGVTIAGIEGKNHVTCIDPGSKYFQGLEGWASDNLSDRADALVGFARGIQGWSLTAMRDIPDFGIAEGAVLPKPSSLIEEHQKAWKEWTRSERQRMRDALRGKTQDENYVADLGEDPPETKLDALLLGELSVSTIERLTMGIMYAALQPAAVLDGGDQGNS